MYKDDIALAQSIMSGDERKFDQFFELYFPRLYRFAYTRMKDESQLEDIVQTTLMNAMRNMDKFRGEATMFTWLCQICRNEIAQHYRKLGKSVPTVTADDDVIRPILEALEAESETDPEGQYANHQVKELISEVLDFLPKNYGQALEWKYVWGLSVTEIAERLHVTELAAQSLLARARAAFRSALTQISPQLVPAGQE